MSSMSVSNSTHIEAAEIISAARDYRIMQNREMAMADYERFKQLLYQYGHYGYERQLADALKI